MKFTSFLMAALALLTVNSVANAGSYAGDYLKIEGFSSTRLEDKWCGGTAKVDCDGRNCEIRVRNSRCDSVELYMTQDGDRFNSNDASYETRLIQTGVWPATYSGNVYIDLDRAQTADRGPRWSWKTYWVNTVVKSSSSNDYQKICPNFKVRY